MSSLKTRVACRHARRIGGSACVLICFAASGAAAPRKAPAHPVVLHSSQLEVILDRDDGLPYEYRLLANQAMIHGEEASREIVATVFRNDPHEFAKVTLRPQNAKAAATRADFQFTAEMGGHAAASFTLRYELQGPSLFVSLESVDEKSGFELIDVATPNLATVREEDGGGWLAHGESGGNLIQLSQAKTGHLPPNRFWGGVAVTLPVVMIGTSKALCVQEVIAFMDTTELAVEGDAGHRSAELGTIAVYRANGSLAYDMNANPGKPLVAGNAKTPNLLVGQRPLARLDFAGDFDRNGVVDWLDGAKIVRARMPEIPSHYYDDKLTYMAAQRHAAGSPAPHHLRADRPVDPQDGMADGLCATGRLSVGLAVSRQGHRLSRCRSRESEARRLRGIESADCRRAHRERQRQLLG